MGIMGPLAYAQALLNLLDGLHAVSVVLLAMGAVLLFVRLARFICNEDDSTQAEREAAFLSLHQPEQRS